MTRKINHYVLGERFGLNGLKLRPADEAECEAWGLSADEAVRESIARSVISYAVVDETGREAKALAVWGYGSTTLSSEVCYAWLLTFPACEQYRYRFGRASRRIVAMLLDAYTQVEVAVHSEHTEARGWLKWLGFQQNETFKSPMGAEFIRMVRGR